MHLLPLPAGSPRNPTREATVHSGITEALMHCFWMLSRKTTFLMPMYLWIKHTSFGLQIGGVPILVLFVQVPTGSPPSSLLPFVPHVGFAWAAGWPMSTEGWTTHTSVLIQHGPYFLKGWGKCLYT